MAKASCSLHMFNISRKCREDGVAAAQDEKSMLSIEDLLGPISVSKTECSPFSVVKRLVSW